MSNKREFETVLKWIAVVILAIVAIKVVFIALALGTYLLFRVLPIVLLVWIVYKVVQWARDSNGNGTTTPV
ncbi:MAG TPA: hypothetical protein VFQ45_04855 [Longimicrobium sp.]|nr:hypothetical protein [Longimicrobium sp.]